jgi:hypothetical protein
MIVFNQPNFRAGLIYKNMKRNFLLGALALVALMLPVVSFAKLPTTSWQVYTPARNLLVVHETDDPNSPICWMGEAFVNRMGEMVSNYDGRCTEPMIFTPLN